MELSIKDRLYLPLLFPKEGSFNDFNLKKDINKKINIDESEAKEINLKQEEGADRIVWDVDKEIPLIVSFSESEQAYLKKCCEAASEKSLPDDIWVVVEKIYDSIEK